MRKFTPGLILHSSFALLTSSDLLGNGFSGLNQTSHIEGTHIIFYPHGLISKDG